MARSQDQVRNTFLRTLSPEDFALLQPHLIDTDLPRRTVLVEENKPVTDVYFPEEGLASIVALTPSREMIEVGLFGFEGYSDVTLDGLLAEHKVPLRTFMQVGGRGLRVASSAFAQATKQSTGLMVLAMRYERYKAVQFAYTALAHGSYNIPERLAIWLLMAQDRLGDDFQIVHEFLAMMLAVRRAGVTEALHKLEGHRAIKAARARIQILDRTKLLELAGGGYGVAEREYERLIGPMRRPDSDR